MKKKKPKLTKAQKREYDFIKENGLVILNPETQEDFRYRWVVMESLIRKGLVIYDGLGYVLKE